MLRQVFDTSERDKFEEEFLRELAAAACLPVQHLHIEQVRTWNRCGARIISAFPR